ncbi:transcription termination factor Rho [Bifidobacterium dolichotidis]|uniref:Transcription termination factor Rho n=1 Tax=Bifidobacterium dolichotidis TaxID=2306976 RepID=A0A430FRG8_9BIFI|nr:transcription termination factor Rho [Bifidobacterium dolichotidis]RSX55471.1 transcription termination factor Rho [Bifidobacterium dolichotidis]
MATSQNLNDMKLPELKELAKQMGLRGTSTLRKDKLVEVLEAARSGAAVPEGVSIKVGNKAVSNESAAASAEESAEMNSFVAVHPDSKAPKRGRRAESNDNSSREESRREENRRDADQEGNTVLSRRVRGKRREMSSREALIEEVASEAAQDAFGMLSKEQNDVRPGVQRRRRALEAQHNHDQHENRRASRNRVADDGLDDILAALPVREGDSERSNETTVSRRGRNLHRNEERMHNNDRRRRNRDDFDREDRNERNERNDRSERMNRRNAMRDENNDRNNRRNNRVEREEHNAEELVPVAGIVDVLESYAFVRTSGYLPGPNDVYVSMGQIKKYGLRKGDAVQGTIRPPHEGEHRNARQKFVPLQSITSINGMSVEEAANRPEFSKLTPLYPQERLVQETDAKHLTGRLIDIVSPIGKGQRGLIVSPPKAGKTITLQNIANSIAVNNPEVHLMVVLVDERPEEVTDMERTVQGEVISSTFDRPASDHTTVAELAIERAKRLVELGQDVVVLLDSMTRLARAYNIAAPASGRILSGGVDAQALYPPKKFFGAARNIENGGSLTIISSALVETGSKMDEVIFEEFKGTGNMELRLSRELADKRLFPAVDINASGTRREELITDPKELPLIYGLRRLLGGLDAEQAYQTLVPRLRKTATNRDFFATMGRGNSNNNN